MARAAMLHLDDSPTEAEVWEAISAHFGCT